MAAVPEVHKATAGNPVTCPDPRAAKAALRSSMNISTRIAGWDSSAMARGVEREPGATKACVTPQRTHSSTRVAQKVACALAVLRAFVLLLGSIVGSMKVEIWSDVVCPWCYIGKKKFEDAVANLAAEGTQLDLEISFRPFQLDPNAPVGGTSPVRDAYAKKFGGPEKADKIIDHVSRVAADAGITFHMDRALRANTLRAHRLMYLALRDHGAAAQREMKQALLEAYFTDGKNVADDEVLIAAAVRAGIGRDEAEKWLNSNDGEAEVRRDIMEAGELGITAVPTFVIDGRWAIPGAQDAEVFERALLRMSQRPAETE